MLVGEEWWRPLPPGLPLDVVRLLAARALRAFVDGMMAVLLPLHLHAQGFSPLAIGALLTATLVGSALATLAVGWLSHRLARRAWLALGCAVMAAYDLLLWRFQRVKPPEERSCHALVACTFS
jgi:MFS family permease